MASCLPLDGTDSPLSIVMFFFSSESLLYINRMHSLVIEIPQRFECLVSVVGKMKY